MRQSISLGNALSAILNCHRHPNAWLCETKQKSRSAAYHNSKSHKSDWKKRSGEFEVVAVNLTSLTVAQAAQHKDYQGEREEFRAKQSDSPGGSGIKESSLSVLAREFQRISAVFNRPVGTFPGKVNLEVE